jgi:2-keto-4-pentenoate hydratase
MICLRSTGLATVLWLCTVPLVAATDIDVMASKVYESFSEKKPLPNLSLAHKLDMSIAYEVQRAYVRSRLNKDKIAGFKAGLTSDGAQARYHITRPIFGVLFNEGMRENHTTFSLSKMNGLMIEAELGFVINEKIYKKINSITELKNYVSQIVPVIELPEVAFESMLVDGTDLVAVNGGAAYFLPNMDTSWLGYDVNSISVSVIYNDQIVVQGQGKDAFGDQWEALRWLVNQVLSHGWVIEKDNILITGALGGMTTAKIGEYKIQYNKGPVIEFSIIE